MTTLAHWLHIGDDKPCPLCETMDGVLIDIDRMGIFLPPIHPSCHCILVRTDRHGYPDPSPWFVHDDPETTRYRTEAFVRYVAWMLRKEIPIPSFLQIFFQRAVRYNQTRGLGTTAEDDDHFQEHLTMPEENLSDLRDLRGNSTQIRIAAQGTITQAEDGQPRIRIMRAGRSNSMRGFPQGVEIPAAVLRAAAADRLFEGVPIFFTHLDNPFHRDVRDMAATIHNASFDGSAIVADYRPTTNTAGQEFRALAQDLHERRAEGLPEPDVGLSFDAFFTLDRKQSPPRALAITDALSVDVVFRPAADGRILAQEVTMPEEVQTHEEEQEEATSAAEATRQPSNGSQERALASQAAQATALSEAADWIQSLARQTVEARLQAANLPARTRKRLAAGTYRTPEELEAAIDDAREELAELAAEGVIQIGPTPPRGRRIHGMATGMDQLQAATNWLFGDPEADTPEPHIRNVHNWYMALTGDYEFRGLFHPDRVTFTGATTATLANMAANAMNKVIIHQFSHLTFYRWYERISLATPNDGSVHDMQWTSVGGVGDLSEVPEKGAYGEIDMDDVKETDSFKKYGGYVPITIEMIRNSDIQRLQSVPRALAIAAVRTRSAKIAEIFTQASGTGPTLSQDSTVLFHANHNNLDTTAFGTDETAWKAAAQEMFKQTEIESSKRLGLFPKYGLFPVDLYHTALSVFGYGEGMPTSYEVFSLDRGEADPRPVPLAVPDWTDTDDWAYIADPRVFPVIHISYAQQPQGGQHPPPELFAVTSPTAGLVFTNDVLPVKVRDWFAYGVNGYRGIGKRNV